MRDINKEMCNNNIFKGANEMQGYSPEWANVIFLMFQQKISQLSNIDQLLIKIS